MADPASVEGSRFKLIQGITLRINLGSTLEEVTNHIYEVLREHLPCNRVAVAVVDPGGERLSIVAVRSDGPMVLGRGYSGPVTGSSLEPLLREGRTRVINDLEEHLRLKPESESTRLIVKEGMRSSLTLPLLIEGAPVGVMFFSSRQPGAYHAGHEELMRAIVGHVAIAVEKSRLGEALREKTEYLENILQNSADAIAVVDAQDRFRTWNEGARRIFGYEADEVLGREYTLLIPPEDRDEAAERGIREHVERQGFIKDHECTRLTKDGRRITVSLTATLLRDRKGRIIGRSSIVRDITHIRKLQEELIRSQSLAAVGELAATVAHEIKNPLAGLSGAIQILQEEIPASSPRRGIVGELMGQIQRLDNTVRDLLTFARPAIPSKQDLPLREAFQRTWTLLSQQPAASGIKFSIEGADGVGVKADPGMFQEVWLNLFQNAIESMPRGGELSVRVLVGPAVRIEVRDSGTGVDSRNLARLFNPFFSTKTRGTGLGLAITRKIIEAHGGKVHMESVPGAGSTVFVEMPR